VAATGLDVFDKTLQTTNIWLDEIMEEVGPDRQLAWHLLAAVLRTLRDRLQLDLAAHLGSQLPLLVRGVYYDQWHPASQPERLRTRDEFLESIAEKLRGSRPINVAEGARSVLHTLARHVEPGQIAKVRQALPHQLQEFWPPASPHEAVITKA